MNSKGNISKCLKINQQLYKKLLKKPIKAIKKWLLFINIFIITVYGNKTMNLYKITKYEKDTKNEADVAQSIININGKSDKYESISDTDAVQVNKVSKADNPEKMDKQEIAQNSIINTRHTQELNDEHATQISGKGFKYSG